jgi:hypothetical protein
MKLAKVLASCAGALFSLGVCTSAALAASSPGDSTLGKATLDVYWSDIKCGVTTPQGTTYAACNGLSFTGLSFTVLVQPGSYAFVTATLNYTYHDDGLPLVVIGSDGLPAIGGDGLPVRTAGVFQSNSFGSVLRVFNEAAGINLISNGCCYPPSYTYSFDGPFLLTFGVNDQPDDLTGQVTFTATAGIGDSSSIADTRTAFIGISNTAVYSSVSPVPEPSTYGLMLAGLLGWAVMAKRRGLAAWVRGWASSVAPAG